MDEVTEFTLKEFLETISPGREILIQDPALQFSPSTISAAVKMPIVELYCTNTNCNGMRYFILASSSYPDRETIGLSKNTVNNEFLIYACKNCGEMPKIFAVTFAYNSTLSKWTGYKYGEYPTFGPPTPAKFIKLIGPDKELFLSGRRSENQGLGIGAFGYYRRVVENQKIRIFDEIIRVINTIEPGNEIIAELEAAKSESQFSKAIDSIKHGLPQSLMIGGHNPLMLLHSALSEGLHAQSDDECLALATDIRVVLVEFAEKLGQALKDDAELSEAVKRLAAKKDKK